MEIVKEIDNKENLVGVLNLFSSNEITTPVPSNNVSQYGATGIEVEDLETSKLYAEEAAKSAEEAAKSAEAAESSANVSIYYSNLSKEEADRAKREADRSKEYADSIAGGVEDANDAAERARLSAISAQESAENSASSAAAALVSQNEAKASEDNAKISEDRAKVSEDNAKDYADKSQEIYEAFAKGAVYRGGWNPMITPTAYPDPLGVNSYWDVYLNAGSSEYEWNGITWHPGDRLIYSVPNAQYFHINGVSGVSSVDGLTGDVTLTDKYVSKKGDVINGELEVVDTTTLRKELRVQGLLSGSNANFVGFLSENGSRVYSPFNKPTPDDIGTYDKATIDSMVNSAGKVDSVNGMTGVVELSASDVGALSLRGGSLTGTLFGTSVVLEGTGNKLQFNMLNDNEPSHIVCKNVGGEENWSVGKISENNDVYLSSSSHNRGITIESDGVYTYGMGQNGLIYTEGNKPQVSDIGGSLTVDFGRID